MKKAILIAVCLFTASVTINAQEASKKTEKAPRQKQQKMTPEQRAQKNVDNIHSVASLSDDQKNKVKELAKIKIAKFDAIKAKYKGQPENKEIAQKELEVVRKEFRQSVKALLTKEQMEKVKAKNKEMKATKGNKSEGNNAIDGND